MLVFGLLDRAVSIYADSYVSAQEFVQLTIPALLLMSWLYLKPEEDWVDSGLEHLQTYHEQPISQRDKAYLSTAQHRMNELKNLHQISQHYTLPFPYLCQIYHLLNLKHLENVHGFSLNNLRVVEINEVKPTAIGGAIKFSTVLDSSINALRIWRQPVVEVDLVLHTPYMVELTIPVYQEKRITVIFNVWPIDEDHHEFLVDIYTDLKWPKLLLQGILHFAASLTLFEDLPYLKKLADMNTKRLFNVRASGHSTMWLFKRFADLYGPKRRLGER
ncbi:hypothetical protein ACQ4M4_18975 [Leptolyngbya sp. AN02str]